MPALCHAANGQAHLLCYVAYFGYGVQPTVHYHCGRMRGQHNLHEWNEAAYQAYELLLPLYMQAGLGFVKKKHIRQIVFHEYGQQYDKYLFLSRR